MLHCHDEKADCQDVLYIFSVRISVSLDGLSATPCQLDYFGVSVSVRHMTSIYAVKACNFHSHYHAILIYTLPQKKHNFSR